MGYPKIYPKIGAIAEYPGPAITCVGVLWRTRYITIDTILIQWDANKWRGILQFSLLWPFCKLKHVHYQLPMEITANEPTAYRHDLKTCTANRKRKIQTIYKLTTSIPTTPFLPLRKKIQHFSCCGVKYLDLKRLKCLLHLLDLRKYPAATIMPPVIPYSSDSRAQGVLSINFFKFQLYWVSWEWSMMLMVNTVITNMYTVLSRISRN